jgi:hypothetical protein
MTRTIFSAVLAAALLAAPLPALMHGATAQTTTSEKKPAKKLTAGQLAAQERQKKCAAEWKEAKAAGTVEKNMTWPRYWSECNKRLKAAGG